MPPRGVTFRLRAWGPTGLEDVSRSDSDGRNEVRVLSKRQVTGEYAFALERCEGAGINGGHVGGCPVEDEGDLLPEDGKHGTGVFNEVGADDVLSEVVDGKEEECNGVHEDGFGTTKAEEASVRSGGSEVLTGRPCNNKKDRSAMSMVREGWSRCQTLLRTRG